MRLPRAGAPSKSAIPCLLLGGRFLACRFALAELAPARSGNQEARNIGLPAAYCLPDSLLSHRPSRNGSMGKVDVYPSSSSLMTSPVAGDIWMPERK